MGLPELAAVWFCAGVVMQRAGGMRGTEHDVRFRNASRYCGRAPVAMRQSDINGNFRMKSDGQG
jgi:hypothetical protein